MTPRVPAVPASDLISTRSLFWLGPVTATVAASVNGLALLMIRAAGQPLIIPLGSGPATPLPIEHVIGASVVAALAATAVFAALVRSARRPVKTFRIVAALVLLVSTGGPVTLAVGASVKLALLALHLLAAITIVGLLTTLSEER